MVLLARPSPDFEVVWSVWSRGRMPASHWARSTLCGLISYPRSCSSTFVIVDLEQVSRRFCGLWLMATMMTEMPVCSMYCICVLGLHLHRPEGLRTPCPVPCPRYGVQYRCRAHVPDADGHERENGS